MVKVEINVPRVSSITIQMSDAPHSEKDLLNSPEYVKFYYTVGLGAPVEVTVIEKERVLFPKKYSFKYTIQGNSISFVEFQERLNKYAYPDMKCDAVHVVDDVQKYVYSFSSYQTAYSFYQKFEGICNIGAYHGAQDGRNVVLLEYHPVP